MASRTLSEYMHYAIAEKDENIWIAQREGRAKDSNDRTQEALRPKPLYNPSLERHGGHRTVHTERGPGKSQ